MLRILQDVVLKLQFNGQAADQCSENSKKLKSDQWLNIIINAGYPQDFLGVIFEAYDWFSALFCTGRAQTELLKSFEMWFSPAVSKFNPSAKTKYS